MKNLLAYTQLQRQAKELGFFYESAQVQAALLAIWQNYLGKDQALATFAVCFWRAGLVLYEPGRIEVLECVATMQREAEMQRHWFIRTSGGSLEPTTQEEVERWLTGTLDVQQYQKNVEDLKRSIRENDAPSLG